MANETLLPQTGTVKGIVGDARAANGSNIKIKGIIDGDLVVESGAVVHVSGIVDGRVINEGGAVTISGIVNG